MSLMQNFIKGSLRRYNPPSIYARTSAGEKLPFSHDKYKATLYVALTDKNLKEIAVKLKMPHESVRRWNTDEDFKKLVDKHRQDYLEEFTKYLEKLEAELIEDNRMFLSNDLTYIATELMPLIDVTEMKDAKHYNKNLLKLIFNRTFDVMKKTDHLDFIVNLMEVFEDVFGNKEMWIGLANHAIGSAKLGILAMSQGEHVEVEAKTTMFFLRLVERINDR